MNVYDIADINDTVSNDERQRFEFDDLFDGDLEEGVYRYGNVYDEGFSNVLFFIVLANGPCDNTVLVYDSQMGVLTPVRDDDSEFSNAPDDFFMKSDMKLFVGVQ